jgi:hypothetical protein
VVPLLQRLCSVVAVSCERSAISPSPCRSGSAGARRPSRVPRCRSIDVRLVIDDDARFTLFGYMRW